jgi:hypothetical protein
VLFLPRDLAPHPFYSPPVLIEVGRALALLGGHHQDFPDEMTYIDFPQGFTIPKEVLN